ncbi:MAG: hypothetical protein WD024_03900 [Bacillota bacterium]
MDRREKSASSAIPVAAMGLPPRPPSSAVWKMSFTLPDGRRSVDSARTVASPKPMAAWQSWPHPCIAPLFTEAKPSLNGLWTGSSASMRSFASMSNRKQIVGPLPSPVTSVARAPVYPPRMRSTISGSAPWANARL